MKKKRFITSKSGIAIMAAVAIALLAFSSVTGARAALTYFSETYTSRVQMYDIGVSLLENGEKVSWRDYKSNSDGEWEEATGELLQNMLPRDEKTGELTEGVIPGKTYDEVISIQNTGTISQFARVTIYKYWLDPNGKKMQSLSPNLIHIEWDNIGTEWLEDTDVNGNENFSPERLVFYCSHVLEPEQLSLPLTKSITIDGMLATKVTEDKKTDENGYTTITTTYDYDGVQFVLEAKVDAVQEHNAQDAIKSAWGRDVTINGTNLSLN